MLALTWLTGALVLAAPAAPKTPSAVPDLIAEARRAIEEIEYDRAMPLLERAERDAPTREQLVELLSLTAEVHAAFDRIDAATEAFTRVLQLEPDFRLATGSAPKLVQALDNARARVVVANAVSAGPVGPSTPASTATASPAPAPRLAAHEPGTPLWRRWWFWAGVGVVAGGAAYGAWRFAHPSAPGGDFGPVPLRETR